MPALLSDAEIASRIGRLGGWKHEGNFITKTFEFGGFMDGVAFVDAIAEIAEKEEHHPDINVRYTTIRLSLQTHSEGGVTEWDIALAEKIEDFLSRERRARNTKHRRPPGSRPRTLA